MAPTSSWRQLYEDEWLFCAVLAFLEDDGDDVHWLWLVALDDGLTTLRARLEQHGAVAVAHARRLATSHSMWSMLLKMGSMDQRKHTPRLSETQVHKIERELTQLGVAPHRDRREALRTAVALDHKSGDSNRRDEACPYCAKRFSHQCSGGFHRCTAPGPRDSQHFCRATTHTTMYAAARDGRLESVVWLHYVVCYDQERALSLAARQGHVEIVTWLLDHAHQNSIHVDFRFRDDPALGVACWRATPFSQCYSLTTQWGMDQSLSDYSAVCLAAKHGDIDGVRRLFVHPNPLFHAEFTNNRLAIYAAASGDVSVLECLRELSPQIFTGSSAMWSAIHNGHLEVAQWLVAHGFDTVNEPRHVRTAVLSGHVNVLQWMMKTASDPKGMRREMASYADGCTSQSTLEWLVREQGLKLSTSTHAKQAVTRKQTALAKWIVEHCTATKPLANGSTLLEAAIKTDNLELVRWFVEDFGVWSPRAFVLAAASRSKTMLTYIYETARASQRELWRQPVIKKHGLHYDPSCLEWLLDHDFHSGLFESGALDAVRSIERAYAAAQRSIGTHSITYRPETMRRFRDTISRMIVMYDIEYIRRVQWLPMWAARFGSLEALKRLIENDARNAFTRKRFDRLLNETVREPIIKWLLEHKPSLFSTLVVRWAVTHGKRGVLKWVFESFLPSHGRLFGGDPACLVRKCVGTAQWHAAARGNNCNDIVAEMQQWTSVADAVSLWREISGDLY